MDPNATSLKMGLIKGDDDQTPAAADHNSLGATAVEFSLEEAREIIGYRESQVSIPFLSPCLSLLQSHLEKYFDSLANGSS